VLSPAAACLLIGRDVGLFPVVTIPLALIAAAAFALTAKIPPAARLMLLPIGTGAFLQLA
jgi:hypothetical protein